MVRLKKLNREDRNAASGRNQINGTRMNADERGSLKLLFDKIRVHPRKSASHKKIFAKKEEVTDLISKDHQEAIRSILAT